jgi:L,D-transpeptidase ErfK/SrfK
MGSIDTRRARRRRRALVTALGLAVVWVTGCAALRRPGADGKPAGPTAWTEETFAEKEIPSYVVPLDAKGAPRETVVGEVTTYTVRKGDTLLDVARWYDLGYNEIVEANPGVDPWVPEPGREIVIPRQFVLPCCDYDGIVVNLPEMRLYKYRRTKDAPGSVAVQTYPVGLGRDDRRTPRGTYRVRGKTVNPQWNIPPRIRKEHIAERGDRRTFIPGGAPDNPLGKHRIELADSLYAIHGTNIPWGIGMLVSHGCLRLYPEDIERLFPDVKVGTKVRFVYQTVKAGQRGEETYVEAHADVYRLGRSLASDAQAALRRRGLAGAGDGAALEAALGTPSGVPVALGSSG